VYQDLSLELAYTIKLPQCKAQLVSRGFLPAPHLATLQAINRLVTAKRLQLFQGTGNSVYYKEVSVEESAKWVMPVA
jgi:hypothetical protein